MYFRNLFAKAGDGGVAAPDQHEIAWWRAGSLVATTAIKSVKATMSTTGRWSRLRSEPV
jgi:hypothetical protein